MEEPQFIRSIQFRRPGTRQNMGRPSFVEPGFSSNTNVRDSEMAKRVKIGDEIQVLMSEGAAPISR